MDGACRVPSPGLQLLAVGRGRRRKRSSENRYTVVRLLAVSDRAVTSAPDRIGGKF
jgi:hypothetical protein